MSEQAHITHVSVTRSGGDRSVRDAVIVEEPLEIRVDGEALAVLMRTPGDDEALTAGFLLTEGVIEVPGDLAGLGPCTDPNRPNAGNILLAQLASGSPEVDARIAQAQRNFYASSSCGLCGKATIESIHQRVTPYASVRDLPKAVLVMLDEQAKARQPGFTATGGCHAAIACSLSEPLTVLASAEDVGRHNAVDKVVGALLLADALPQQDAVLWVSGRASFEMVQKALMAGFSALICVGAPTSLAVEMAEESRLGLVGFATGPDRFNVYSGRVTGE